MTSNLREMTAFDLPTVISMEREIYTTDAWSVSQFKEELALVPLNRFYLVAVNGASEIVGYGGVFSPGGGLDAEILTLTVAVGSRRKGIGRNLLNELLAWARQRHAATVFLEVREGNEEAAPLYLSEGFVEISRRHNYYSAGVHAVVMKKELS